MSALLHWARYVLDFFGVVFLLLLAAFFYAAWVSASIEQARAACGLDE